MSQSQFILPPSGQPTHATPSSGAGLPAPVTPFRTKPWLVVAAGLVAVGALSACGSDTDSASDAAPVTVTVTSEAPSAPSSPVEAPVAEEDPATEAAPEVDFVMPDLTGVDLQTAQNTVQDNGVFFSVSHDLRGSRSQVLDSNWIVCTQNVAAGQHVSGDAEGKIDFGAVKRGETCP